MLIDLFYRIWYDVYRMGERKGDSKMNWAAFVWFVLMLLFLMMESTTVMLISVWFAVGALTAVVASLFGAHLWLQIILFFAVSGGLLALLRPIFQKYIAPKIIKTNVDAVVGSVGLVTAAVDNLKAEGQVKLGGMEWTARSSSGENLPVGMRIKVDRIEGVKVFVSPAEVSADIK